MMRRRRPIARGAMVAGVGYAAGSAHAKKAAHETEQEQRIAELEAQSAPPAPAPSPSPPAPTTDRVAQLTQLKALLDTGALSQAEFDAEKARILSA